MTSCLASLVNLVRQDVTVIVAGGGDNAVMAAKRATATIPIVFISGSDPVRSGFVASLSHPGDNITGLSLATPELLAKRLEILHKLAPQLTSLAALVNPENHEYRSSVAIFGGHGKTNWHSDSSRECNSGS